MNIHGVLIDLGDVPLGATVTKRTGSKTYTVADKVRIFTTTDAESKVVEIPAARGCRFLVKDTDISAVPATDIVRWLVDTAELADALERHLEGEPQ